MWQEIELSTARLGAVRPTALGQAARHTDTCWLVASPGAGHRSRAGSLAAQIEAERLAAGLAAGVSLLSMPTIVTSKMTKMTHMF